MKELKERFFIAASPLKYFLLCLGIEWNPSKFFIVRVFFKLWGILVLLTNVVIGSIYLERLSEPEILNIFVGTGKNEATIDSLMRMIDRLNKVACNILTHLLLFFSLAKLFRGYLEQLEKVDITLRRPDLSRFKRISAIGIIWILLLVSASVFYTVFNHRIVQNPYTIKLLRGETKALLWYYFFQSTVYTGFRIIPSASAFIYYIASELLIIYYHRIFKSLKLLIKIDNQSAGKQMSDSTFKRIIFLAKTCSILNQASRYIQSGMGLILLINCSFVFINSFMNMFYFVWRIGRWTGFLDKTGIHVANFIETTVRFLLFCHATDRLNSSSYNFALKLRKLRGNKCLSILSSLQRTKVTLLIVENYRTFTKSKVVGTFVVSKGLFITLTDITMTYLSLMFQYGVMSVD